MKNDYNTLLTELNNDLVKQDFKTFPYQNLLESIEQLESSQIVSAIWDSLKKDEKDYLFPNNDFDPENLEDIIIRLISDDKTSFLDIFKIDKLPFTGFILMGTHPKGRGKGNAKDLLNQAISLSKKKGLKELRASILNSNKPSENIIKNSGFKKIRDFSDKTGAEYKLVL